MTRYMKAKRYKQFYTIKVGDTIEISMDNGKSILREVFEIRPEDADARIKYRNQAIWVNYTRITRINQKEG
jgi:hypothetical protein